MYETFFGLQQKPFSLLPDAGFLYLGKSHDHALSLLGYWYGSRTEFAVVTGDIGCGKTTLIRYLLDQLGEDINLGLVSNTHLSLGSLFQLVLSAFDVESVDETKVDQYRAFTEFLSHQHKIDRRTVLVIDEAQHLDQGAIEELRMLSNINTGRDLIIQFVLFGQPQLRETLRQPGLRGFVQRAVDCCIEPLDEEETTEYIRHRLQMAGTSEAIFRRDSYPAIYHYTQGVPRLINQLCDTSLVCAYGTDRKQVSGQIVESVIQDRPAGMILEFNHEPYRNTLDRDDTLELQITHRSAGSGKRPKRKRAAKGNTHERTMTAPDKVAAPMGSDPMNQPTNNNHRACKDETDGKTQERSTHLMRRITPGVIRDRPFNSALVAVLALVVFGVGLSFLRESMTPVEVLPTSDRASSVDESLSAALQSPAVQQESSKAEGLDSSSTALPQEESGGPDISEGAVVVVPAKSEYVKTEMVLAVTEEEQPATAPFVVAIDEPVNAPNTMITSNEDIVFVRSRTTPATVQHAEGRNSQDNTVMSHEQVMKTPVQEARIAAPPSNPHVVEDLKSQMTVSPGNPQNDPSTNALEKEIADSLERAELLLAQKRLTRPKGQSALDMFARVLILSPTHEGAQQGLYRIAETYQSWATAAEQRGEWPKSVRYYRRALEALPSDGDLLAKLRGAEQSTERHKQHLASESRRDAERRLQKRGLNVASKTLLESVERGDLTAVRLLLDAGLSANTKGEFGFTPLVLAAIKGQVKIAAELLRGQADVNARSDDGRTALMAAAWNGQNRIANLLIDKGATVDLRSNEGWTALTYAVLKGDNITVKTLLAKGADPTLKDQDGLTPLAIANEQGYDEVADLIASHVASD